MAGKFISVGLLAKGRAIKFTALGGGFAAKLFGAGTAANPAIMSAVGANAIQLYVKHTGASGATRLAYLRLYLAGGGTSSGEALRAFTTINTSTGTAHGAHISLSFALTKALSGLGVASRNTLHIPNDTSPTGTLAATQAEVFLDGTSSTMGTAQVSLIRAIVDGGDATARARVKNFLSLVQPGSGSGNMLETGLTAATVNAACTKAIRIIIDGTAHWIPVATAIT